MGSDNRIKSVIEQYTSYSLLEKTHIKRSFD